MSLEQFRLESKRPDPNRVFCWVYRKSRLGLELPTVGTSDLCQNSRHGDYPRHPSRFLQAFWKSRHLSELSTVGSPDLGRNSRQRSIFMGAQLLHPDSELDVPYMFFDHLDERNAMVKSVSHFNNFIKINIFGCQHMPPVFKWMMHKPENT